MPLVDTDVEYNLKWQLPLRRESQLEKEEQCWRPNWDSNKREIKESKWKAKREQQVQANGKQEDGWGLCKRVDEEGIA